MIDFPSMFGKNFFSSPHDIRSGNTICSAHCKDIILLLLETALHNKYLITLVEMRHIKNSIEGGGTILHIYLPTDRLSYNEKYIIYSHQSIMCY